MEWKLRPSTSLTDKIMKFSQKQKNKHQKTQRETTEKPKKKQTEKPKKKEQKKRKNRNPKKKQEQEYIRHEVAPHRHQSGIRAAAEQLRNLVCGVCVCACVSAQRVARVHRGKSKWPQRSGQ
jgi:hypothetical protein